MRILLFSCLPLLTVGFVVDTIQVRSSRQATMSLPRTADASSSRRFIHAGGTKNSRISISTPGLSYENPDLDRAKECAEHFGKCSFQELKDLKEGLHRKRIQEAALGPPIDSPLVPGSTAPEDVFQERLLEEELSLQLNLMHSEMPPPYLFNSGDLDVESTAAKVRAAKNEQLIELLEEEGVIDSLAICALIALVMVVPQFVFQ